MTAVVVDASALAAVVFEEPDGKAVSQRLDGATVFAPHLLKFELTNTAWKKARRQPAATASLFTALAIALDAHTGIVWRDVDAVEVALLAHATGLTAYDASYVWLAGSLGADLVTLDTQLTALGADRAY